MSSPLDGRSEGISYRGVVAALHRWPVKSFGGEQVTRAFLGPYGMAGDRTHALIDRRSTIPQSLSARRIPGLLRWLARYDFPLEAEGVQDASPLVTSPQGRVWRWDDPGLRRALHDDLGIDIDLTQHPQGMPDEPGLVLVTFEPSRRSLERLLGGDSLDILRFRPNIHLDTNTPPFAEQGWNGHRIVTRSGVSLRIVEPCPRCSIITWDPRLHVRRRGMLKQLLKLNGGVFGVYARVENPGPIEMGDDILFDAGS